MTKTAPRIFFWRYLIWPILWHSLAPARDPVVDLTLFFTGWFLADLIWMMLRVRA